MARTSVDKAELAQENGDTRLLLQHYGVFLLAYGFYGYQVCPFLDNLTLAQLLAPAVAAVGAHFTARTLWRRWCRSAPLIRKVSRLFWGDFLLFAVLGAVIATYNYALYGFPVDSGGKVFFAFCVIGFYVSLDLAFEREFRIGAQLTAAGEAFPVNSRFMPYQTKFVAFSMLNIFFVTAVSIMVALKDLVWVAETTMDAKEAQLLVMMEICFVLGVLGAYILRVVRQYSRKLDANLAAENSTLRAVRSGNFNASVAVTSNDEFGHMAHLTNHMIARLRASIEEVAKSRDAMMMALVGLSEKRDNETGLHLKRTQAYMRLIAEALRASPDHRERVTDDYVDLLHRAAPLHDIGKVGVPDSVLRKSGKLDDEEFKIMQTHPLIGAAALEEADRALGGSPFLQVAREIALTHHEKWDGSGYPQGLAGEDIPLAGRIMAVADVYDALRTQRVYKPAFSREKARGIIEEGSGGHFDPAVVRAFLSVEPTLAQIAENFSDSADESAKDKIVA